MYYIHTVSSIQLQHKDYNYVAVTENEVKQSKTASSCGSEIYCT